MRLSTNLDYAASPRELAEQAVALEAAGIDLLWVAEAYSFDAPSLMGFLAARTERVEIGSGILPLYSRTPSLLAMTAAGVDALSGGRCVLGLGASGPQVIEGWHGVPYDRPLARTREVVEICRIDLDPPATKVRRRHLPAAAARRPGHRPREAPQADQPARP